jgi:hypothetical protein
VKYQERLVFSYPIYIYIDLKYSLLFIPAVLLLLDLNSLVFFASISTARKKLESNRYLIYISNLG